MNDVTGLDITILENSNHALLIELEFKNEYEFFEGHFDDFKILPALIQIHLVSEFTQKYLSLELNPKNIPSLKFVKPIKPNIKIELIINKNELMRKVDFTFKRSDQIYSSGSLKYEV